MIALFSAVLVQASLVAPTVKCLPCSVGDPGMIFGSGRSTGEGKGNPLWYFCLENSMERRQEGCRTWSRKDSEMTEQLCCSCAVTQSSPALCNTMDCWTPGLPVLCFTELLILLSIELVMPSNHLALCPLLLLPSIFPSIRVFLNELDLPIRWPKDWSFSLSNSPTNEYSGLISFRIAWFDLLVVQGLSRVSSNTTAQKHQLFSPQRSLWSNSHIHTRLL